MKDIKQLTIKCKYLYYFFKTIFKTKIKNHKNKDIMTDAIIYQKDLKIPSLHVPTSYEFVLKQLLVIYWI